MIAGYKNRYILELLNIYAYFCRLKDMKPAYYIKNPAIASEEALHHLLEHLLEQHQHLQKLLLLQHHLFLH